MDIRLGAGQVALMTTTQLITTFAQLTLCLSIARSLSSIFSFLTRFFYGGEKREPVFFTSSVDSLASLLAASTFLVSRRYIFDFLRIVRRALAVLSFESACNNVVTKQPKCFPARILPHLGSHHIHFKPFASFDFIFMS